MSLTRRTTLSCGLYIGASLVTAVVMHVYHRKKQEQEKQAWSARRKEERVGRIRAEVKLRTVLKELEQLKLLKHEGKHNKESVSSDDNAMLMKCIGKVSSPYTKRMGTPRQPQLVPASRGYIEFTCQAAALDGIQEYSHVWIIFGFHANTNTANVRLKIRPPRAGGKKVGQLATRSPHRPNTIGLSLVRLEQWDASTRQLHLTGLDLVHGTPVYDIKPFVPWDVPNPSNKTSLGRDYHVPEWVQQEDDISQVVFTAQALQGLHSVVVQDLLHPFYTTQNEGCELAQQALEQILSQDPRSSHKGLKSNGRGTNSLEKQDPYSICFGQCQVFFLVEPEQVQVVDVLPFDSRSWEHVDGIPLVSLPKNVTNQ